MTMTRAQFLSLMTEGLRKVFFQQYKEKEQIYPRIFDVTKSRKRQEQDQTIAGIGMLTAKDEGKPITYEDMVEGYAKTFTHTAFAKGMRVSRELIDDDQYGVISKRTKALARAASYRKEYDHAQLFNNAAATTYYTGGDGLALLSDAHTLANAPGVTFDNQAASTALSATALENALTYFARLVDDTNMLISLTPKTLLIPPELEWDAIEILQSTNKAGTADNDVNALRGRLDIVVWPFLTGTTDWFVLCDKSDIAPLSFDRVPVEFDNDGDFDTKDLKVSAYTRYSLGFTDPRFCYGRQG